MLLSGFRMRRKSPRQLREAGRQARLKHKQMGVPIVIWRDDQIVEIPPEEIVVDPPLDPSN
jgi:hypothetical protein